MLCLGAWLWHTQGENIINSIIGEHVAHEELAILAEFEERVAQLQQENQQLQQQAAYTAELQAENESLKQQTSSLVDHKQVQHLEHSIQKMSKLSLLEK